MEIFLNMFHTLKYSDKCNLSLVSEPCLKLTAFAVYCNYIPGTSDVYEAVCWTPVLFL